MAARPAELPITVPRAASHRHDKVSPLARSAAYRLGWAASLSAALWLAVWWALT